MADFLNGEKAWNLFVQNAEDTIWARIWYYFYKSNCKEMLCSAIGDQVNGQVGEEPNDKWVVEECLITGALRRTPTYQVAIKM